MINVKVVPPHRDIDNIAKMIRHPLDVKGKVIGNHNECPIHNTYIYDVEFQNGIIKLCAQNVIAQNILIQVDSEGYHSQQLESISE